MVGQPTHVAICCEQERQWPTPVRDKTHEQEEQTVATNEASFGCRTEVFQCARSRRFGLSPDFARVQSDAVLMQEEPVAIDPASVALPESPEDDQVALVH
eukprot:2503072-Amphidinium_carterae.2